MDQPHFVYLPVDGHLGYFHLLTIIKNACIDVYVFMQTYISISLGCIREELLVTCSLCVNPLRKGQATFQRGCTILRSHQQSTKVPFLLSMFVTVFVIRATLLGMKSYLSVVSICISLMPNYVGHLFMWLLAM